MRLRHFSQRAPQTGDGFHAAKHRAQICMPKRSFPSRDDGHGPPFPMSNPFAMLITSAARLPPASTRVRLARSHALASARHVFGVVYRVWPGNVLPAFWTSASVYFPVQTWTANSVHRFVPKRTHPANVATALRLHFFMSWRTWLSMYFDDIFYRFLFSVRFSTTKGIETRFYHKFDWAYRVSRAVSVERRPCPS